jgi:hypothetical protein
MERCKQRSGARPLPFRDGSIEVTDREIVVWKKNPDAVFHLMRKNPVRDRVEYVLGRCEP